MLIGLNQRAVHCIFVLIIIEIVSTYSFLARAELIENWTSARALGMGNAYSAVVDDSDSLFYNPAGLARSGVFQLTFADPRVGLNGLNAYSAVQAFQNSSDVAQAINDLYGKNIWIGGGAKTAVVTLGFGAAAFGSTDGALHLENPAYPHLHAQYFADYGVVVGYGFDLIPGGFLKAGFAGKRVTRLGTSGDVSPSTLASLDTKEIQKSFQNRGTGYGFDLGLVATIPSPVSPSISVAWKNVGYMGFTHDAGAAAPSRVPPELDVGAALNIDLLLLSITPAIEYKYLNRDEIQMGKKMHVGLEIGLPLISVRAGLNQGYYTLGAGVDIGLVSVDVASYGVELGEYPGQLEDRRYMVQATMELGLNWLLGGNSSGDGSGKNGSSKNKASRRHLKQRR